MQRIRGFEVLAGLMAAGFAACGLATQASAQQPLVDKLVLADTIQPVTAAELDRAIARANRDGAQALLVELDTPGGLLDSTRTMAGAILSSRVPVIVYVAPAGARAGSAGFFLLESADVAAMAPGTNAGAAHPVLEFGPQPDATMNQKIENDAEAFLRSYVTRRNRNAEAAEAAVHSSHSYTAEEALDQHLIDLTASNDWELLRALDGRTITRMDGNKLVLHLARARIEVLRPSLRDGLLGWLVNPNIALLLLVGGALLIYLEFNAPGTIVPGALGTLMMLLAIFGLNLLPVQHTAILLLFAALALMVLEAKFASHGVLGTVGVLCLVFGLATLVNGPSPEMRVHFGVAAGAGVGFGVITFGLAWIAVKARQAKRLTGPQAMLGQPAIAMTPLLPAGELPIGQVEVRGEIWKATLPPNSPPVPAGTQLTVRAVDNLTLTVAP